LNTIYENIPTSLLWRKKTNFLICHKKNIFIFSSVFSAAVIYILCVLCVLDEPISPWYLFMYTGGIETNVWGRGRGGVGYFSVLQQQRKAGNM
jgi:hypothetical protein